MRKTLVSMLSGALLFAGGCATRDAPVPNQNTQPTPVVIQAPAVVEAKKEEPKTSSRPDTYESNGYSVRGAIGGHSIRNSEEDSVRIPVISFGKDATGKPVPYVVGYNEFAEKNELPFTFTRRDTFRGEVDRSGKTVSLENTVYGVFAREETIDTPKSERYPNGKKPATELWTSRNVEYGELELKEDGTGDSIMKFEGLREFAIKYGPEGENTSNIHIFTMAGTAFGAPVGSTRQVYEPVTLPSGEKKLRVGYRNDDGFFTLREVGAKDYAARGAPKPKPVIQVPEVIEVMEVK